MAKDPAVLFYVQDFLIGSSLMTPAQKGHYITLLCYQQQSDTGSIDQDQIKSLMHEDFATEWAVIKKKFQKDSNGFFNARMRSEIDRRKKYSESRRSNRAKKGEDVLTHDKDMSNICRTYEQHMETATEIVLGKGVQGENQQAFFEVFRRCSSKSFSDSFLQSQILLFKNKYQNAKPVDAGLINAWVSRMAIPKSDKKEPIV